MANWSAVPSLRTGGNPVVEPPNAVAYIDYISDDDRQDLNVRTPYADESDLLVYIAQECQRRSDLDDRNEQMKAVVDASTLVVGQPIKLHDFSAQQALVVAQRVLTQKVNAALQQKQLSDATAIDSTIADAKAARDAAQAAVADAAVVDANIVGK